MSWHDKKRAHRALSAAAAEQYDAIYDASNFATGSYMQYELDIINRWAPRAPSPTLAVDLGCGTGRDSFALATHFDQVYGYDFSPEMIRVATKNRLAARAGNVLFEIRDAEDAPLPLGTATVSFVNTAFGMGSFIQHPETLFREIRRILQPHGLAVFSFYNKEALVNHLDLEWRPALAARIVEGEDTLAVDFEGHAYRIPAIAYTVDEIRKRLAGNFKVLQITTYPTLSALLPQSLFRDERAKALCARVDRLLASNVELAAGPYIVAVCRKGGPLLPPNPLSGYALVLHLLRVHRIPRDLREHAPVRTMEAAAHVVEAPPEQMVKSLLIAAAPPSTKHHETSTPELFLCAVPAHCKLDMGKTARALGIPRKHLRFATQIEVEERTGFQAGSIPPFGLPKNVPVLVDQRLIEHPYVWCGTGKATESLRLSLADLKRLSAFSVADLAKPAPAWNTSSASSH